MMNAYFYENDEPESGHGSVGRMKEIDIIKSLLNKEEIKSEWAFRG